MQPATEDQPNVQRTERMLPKRWRRFLLLPVFLYAMFLLFMIQNQRDGYVANQVRSNVVAFKPVPISNGRDAVAVDARGHVVENWKKNTRARNDATTATVALVALVSYWSLSGIVTRNRWIRSIAVIVAGVLWGVITPFLSFVMFYKF